jgi:hypothetical protein
MADRDRELSEALDGFEGTTKKRAVGLGPRRPQSREENLAVEIQAMGAYPAYYGLQDYGCTHEDCLRPLRRGEFNGSAQHLLILRGEEVRHGDVTDLVHGSAEG